MTPPRCVPRGAAIRCRFATPRFSPAPLEERVTAALEVLLGEGLDGDVLVFLPGAAEIRRAARARGILAGRANLLVLPLHGDLPLEEQERAVQPADRRKLILSTNVAESSVTIEGVTAVIDSGLARVAAHSPWSGLPRVEVRRISRASAEQRAGRAGRIGPGRVIRLCPLEEFVGRPEHDTPEILRKDLSRTLLDLRAMGLRPEVVRWLEAPPEAAWEAARRLLVRLGALSPSAELTPARDCRQDRFRRQVDPRALRQRRIPRRRSGVSLADQRGRPDL